MDTGSVGRVVATAGTLGAVVEEEGVANEGKFGFVSHTKLTAEATFMDLFHS